MLIEVIQGPKVGDSRGGMVNVPDHLLTDQALRIAFFTVNKRGPRDYNELMNSTAVITVTHTVSEDAALMLSNLI